MSAIGFPGGSVVKNPPISAGDTGSIPGSGRSPGKEYGYHSRILARESKSHGQSILAGYTLGVAKE